MIIISLKNMRTIHIEHSREQHHASTIDGDGERDRTRRKERKERTNSHEVRVKTEREKMKMEKYKLTHQSVRDETDR